MLHDPLRGEDRTTSDLRLGPPSALSHAVRAAGTAALVLVLVLAALNLLGPRTGTVRASAQGYSLTVAYPAITRAGQPAPLQLTVDGSLGSTVRLRLCQEFFRDSDFQSWFPTPSAETSDEDWIEYEFDAPSTGALEIALDSRTAPGQFGQTEECAVSVMVDDEPTVSATFRVWRLP
ncbi:MAG: hypothetical protein ACI379_02180 [Nocardioides sp.]|uniref:hypothetical protein n=1 Tax=Nocardioides sp. TaxID=35761 RepID=UPI003F007D25